MVTQRGAPVGGRRSLRRDTRGLSTVEYVIILLAVGLVGIAAWRGFGSTASTRTTEATGTMGSLDGPATSGESTAGGGGSGRRVAGRSHLDEATADAAPPPEPAAAAQPEPEPAPPPPVSGLLMQPVTPPDDAPPPGTPLRDLAFGLLLAALTLGGAWHQRAATHRFILQGA